MKLQMQGMKVVYLPRKKFLYKFWVFFKVNLNSQTQKTGSLSLEVERDEVSLDLLSKYSTTEGKSSHIMNIIWAQREHRIISSNT